MNKIADVSHEIEVPITKYCIYFIAIFRAPLLIDEWKN